MHSPSVSEGWAWPWLPPLLRPQVLFEGPSRRCSSCWVLEDLFPRSLSSLEIVVVSCHFQPQGTLSELFPQKSAHSLVNSLLLNSLRDCHLLSAGTLTMFSKDLWIS